MCILTFALQFVVVAAVYFIVFAHVMAQVTTVPGRGSVEKGSNED